MKNILLIFITILYSFSGIAQWQQSGITTPQSYVTSFCLSNNKQYSGASSGVLSSTDNGSNWYVQAGFSSILSMVSTGNNIFAGSIDGVLRSTNNGANWYFMSSGLPSTPYVYHLAVSGNNIFAGTNVGIFLSTDNGTSWAGRNNGLPNNVISALGINGSDIFVNAYGIHKSTNNGDTWQMSNTGIPNNTTVISFAFSGNNIFAGTTETGVYISTNNGGNWSQVSNGLSLYSCETIVCYGVNIFAGINYGGVFLSTNNGTNWTDVSTGLTNNHIISLFVYDNFLYAGTEYSGSIWRRPLSEMIGIKEIESKISIGLYPNPATDQITIRLQDIQDLSNSLLSVYNIQGQMLLQQSIHEQQTEINISHLPQGIYFVKIRLADGAVAEKKFVVVR